MKKNRFIKHLKELEKKDIIKSAGSNEIMKIFNSLPSNKKEEFLKMSKEYFNWAEKVFNDMVSLKANTFKSSLEKMKDVVVLCIHENKGYIDLFLGSKKGKIEEVETLSFLIIKKMNMSVKVIVRIAPTDKSEIFNFGIISQPDFLMKHFNELENKIIINKKITDVIQTEKTVSLIMEDSFVNFNFFGEFDERIKIHNN